MWWLADVLRAGGLHVIETSGWQDRGRPGIFGPVKGVLCHHTGPGSTEGLRRLITEGRADLAGPLSHLFLDRDGTFYVIAAGRCNHAGYGRWQGVENGNRYFIGIEAANSGTGEPWPAAQMAAYACGVAAILNHVGADSSMAVGHKEYALPKGRKIDPSFDMLHFREKVEACMVSKVTDSTLEPPPPILPAHAMLRRGDRDHDSVRYLQRKLGLTADGDFGPQTEYAVMEFQRAHGLAADGKVGPKTWEALGIK